MTLTGTFGMKIRRKDRQNKDKALQEAIIKVARVAHLGLCDNGQPYVVPLCFGYDSGVIYCHSALSGRKIELLKRNPQVCVEFSSDGALEIDPTACKWGLHYQSVIAFGKAELVIDVSEKKKGLDIIMAQYHGTAVGYSEKMLAGTAVIKIGIDQMTSKRG